MAAPIMTQEETLNRMLAKAQRKTGTPVRRAFVQRGTRQDPKPGPLATFVANADNNGLNLYLLLLTLATKEPYHVAYAGGWWARAIGVENDSRISKAWRRLEDRRLIERKRQGRIVVVTPLLDDGSGSEYRRPAGGGESYGRLPAAYWEDGYFRELKMPGKAMLLIALAQPGKFTLPSDRAKRWYGISADTVEAGFAELRKHKILAQDRSYRVDRWVPSGYAPANLYYLLPPFSSKGVVPLTVVS